MGEEGYSRFHWLAKSVFNWRRASSRRMAIAKPNSLSAYLSVGRSVGPRLSLQSASFHVPGRWLTALPAGPARLNHRVSPQAQLVVLLTLFFRSFLPARN